MFKVSQDEYDYVVREAFREELSKLSYAPAMIEALLKLAAINPGPFKPAVSNPFRKAPLPAVIGGKSLLGGGGSTLIEHAHGGPQTRMFSMLRKAAPTATVR